jgi:tripartite motif-containing protein 56
VTIAVGQPSANTAQPSTFSSPGGGGGTFVVLPGNFPLIVAGGGGGPGNWTGNGAVYFAGNGVTTSFGGNSLNGAPGGFNGWGGNSHVNLIGVTSTNLYDSGGGGGFLLPGVVGTGANVRPGSSTQNSTGQGGWHFLANLTGGTFAGTYPPPSTSAGGFGGGGGPGPITGGGGGGYSGGSGAYSNSNTQVDQGGGGGSWIAANATAVATSDGQYERNGTFGGASITNLATVNNGPGYVTITKV